jgi:hypothetical protein
MLKTVYPISSFSGTARCYRLHDSARYRNGGGEDEDIGVLFAPLTRILARSIQLSTGSSTTACKGPDRIITQDVSFALSKSLAPIS